PTPPLHSFPTRRSSDLAGSARPLSSSSRRLRVEGHDPDEVVDGSCHQEPGSVSPAALVPELAAAGDGLDPPERLLDALADPLARSEEHTSELQSRFDLV